MVGVSLFYTWSCFMSELLKGVIGNGQPYLCVLASGSQCACGSCTQDSDSRGRVLRTALSSSNTTCIHIRGIKPHSRHTTHSSCHCMHTVHTTKAHTTAGHTELSIAGKPNRQNATLQKVTGSSALGRPNPHFASTPDPLASAPLPPPSRTTLHPAYSSAAPSLRPTSASSRAATVNIGCGNE